MRTKREEGTHKKERGGEEEKEGETEKEREERGLPEDTEKSDFPRSSIQAFL